MKFKKKLGYVSKTFLASMVIFNLAITTAAYPVVSLAFEGDAAESRDNSETASQTSNDGDKGDSGKVEGEKTDQKEDGPKTEDPKKEEPPKETPEKGGSSGGGSSNSSGSRPNKGVVKGEETASCDVGNLIVNGSFETPTVTHASDWNIYPSGTSGLGWSVAWNGAFVGAPQTANMEIQNGVNGWNAYLGTQYAELDADWGGPTDPVSGEQASTIISQTIDTVPGNTYSLHFAFAARPGTMAADNKLGIYIDDGVFDLSTVSSFGEYYSDQPYWIVRDYEFKAYNEQTKISFADIGTANSVGSFLDDVRVHCVKEGGGVCPANNMIYARVKLTPQPYGWRNWGNGNTSGKIFVGGSNASNVYESNEWFPLTNPDGSFIEDADIAAYRDVPGIALQRSEGTVRIVLYGYLYDEVKPVTADGRIEGAVAKGQTVLADRSGSSATVPNYYMLNRELSQGSLEFSTDMATRSTTVIPTSQMSDPANPMDHVAGVHQYHPGSDSFRIISNLSQWHMLTTTGSDGFITKYDDNRPGDDKDCPPEGKTGSLIVNKVIQGQGNGTFHFNGPNGVFDITTTNGEGALQINNLDEGTYTVTEINMAGWDMVSSTCTNVVVTDDNATECTIVNTMDDGNPGCDSEKNDCPGEGSCDSGAIWARVNVEDFSNLGTGNVTSNIYLGSNSNIVASGEWFMVYDGSNYINDADIMGYKDVAGLAIQRMNGKLRVMLFGTDLPSSGHREYIEGNIEFFSGLVTSVNEETDPYFKLEDGTDGAFDYTSYAGDRAYFDIQVQDKGGDSFFVKYVYSLDEDCGNGGDEDPGIEVGDRCVLWGTDFPMDRITITNNDGTLDHNNIFVFDLNTFHADIPGSYPLTVTLKDDNGVTIDGPTVFVFTVAPEGAKDCDNGNGGENTPPTITAPETVCILTTMTQQTYNFLKDVTTADADGDTLTVYFSHNIVFEVEGGPFTITYTVYDTSNASGTDTTVVNVKSDCGDGGTGGGDDDNPVLTIPGDACIVKGSVESFDLLSGVSAVDFSGDAIVLDIDGEDANLVIVGSVNVGENGTYPLVYTVTDPFGTDQAGRTVTIADDCSNGGGGGDDGCDESEEDCDNGGGGGGGSSSSGGRGGRRGEVLGAETGSCVAFTQYNDTGSTKSEVKALQTFLNEYMDAGLTVNGTYDRATTQAVHDFQAFHWDDIIDPWTPPLSPNTTGREYKTTRATINAIIECPEAPVYLEDPQTMFSIIEVKNKKAFTESQIDKVTELLLDAQSGAVSEAK